MRRGFRNVLLAALALTGVAVWAGTRVGQAVQLSKTEPADKLVKASVCVASAYHVMPGTNATMSVQNDGGWCWVDTYDEKQLAHPVCNFRRCDQAAAARSSSSA